jgi:hypothetical protein
MRASLLIALFLPLLLAAPAGSALADRTGLPEVADKMVERGDALVAAYDPSDGFSTSDGFSDLYFDVFEGGGLGLKPRSAVATPAEKRRSSPISRGSSAPAQKAPPNRR